MQKIRFIESNSEYIVSLKMHSNRIICVFDNETDASTAPLSEGFLEINEHNGIVQSDYSDYKYIYKEGADKITFIFTSNKNDIYVESEDNITNSDFESEFYVPSLEEIKRHKINELSSICNSNIINGVDIVIDNAFEHFSYNNEDQTNIKEIFDLAVQTNVPMYYHADGASCKLYTVEQIIKLYVTVSTNKMHHTTYFNQLKLYINTLESVEEIKAITYGQELTGEYLETYNASMAQSQLVLEALLSQRDFTLSEG